MSTRNSVRRVRRRAAFVAQLFVVAVVLANAAWYAADGLKRLEVFRRGPPVLDWARQFRHPDDAALLPYVASALAAFGWGLFLYARLRPGAVRTLRRLRRTALARSAPFLVVVSSVQVLIVFPALPRALRMILAFASLFACAVPLPPRAVREGPLARLPGTVRRLLPRASGTGVNALAIGCTLALLVALAVEPVRLAAGPVRLLNEYPVLAERPVRGGEELATGDARSDHCAFAHANPVEYAFQSMSRGQLNHIGHVLNPLNEHATGKPFRSTYFQYGVGATLAFGWVMDLFGGLSLQAYYRSLLLFVLYELVFVSAAIVLLRDARYVLAATGLLGLAYYALGFNALLLAPGVNPLLHFLDLPVLLALRPFFRTGRPAPLALGVAGAAAALALNPLFGVATTAALAVSAGLYLFENAAPGRRAARIVALGAALAAALAAVALLLPRTAGAGITSQFVQGFFSWSPSPLLVLATLVYLGGSYLFLLWVRDARDPLKYAAVYLFVYAQGFLLYFFWSGLDSHFWPALPYIGLHALVMLRMAAQGKSSARWEPALLLGVVLAVGIAGVPAVEGFVAERNAVGKIFTRWETHEWPFPRARVVATADPAPIAASLDQLARYSGPEDRGVCMLSILDGLLPFLAGRHSVFPHFDLQWALLTDGDRRRMVEVIAAARPRHLFVGREVEEGAAVEPGPSCELGMDLEEKSARGRIGELRRVFEGVSGDYELIERGPLLSVYRRRD